MTDSTKAQILEVARRAVHTEMLALKHMEETLGDSFAAAVELILASRGKCIVTGMGKSGLVGRKIAATLASTGTPSFFLHPGEAFHGDLGMISKEDIVLALSYSGETDEILKIVPFIHSNGNRLISMTGHPDSALAKNSDVHLDVGVREEACILHLAPTSSTTAQIAMGDALAVSLMQMRGFTSVDFARLHPGGSLGRRLLMTVGNVMRDHDLPVVAPDCPAAEMIHAISKGGLGLIVICDGDRIEGMIKNAVYGIIAAKACGVKEPTLGILNVDGARQTEMALKELQKNGYDFKFAESARADGGAVMRGNDVLQGTPDVMVMDSLTGNVMVKMLSSFTTGGSFEASGYGYGPGIGEGYDKLIMIVSRASGAPVIANALEYAAQLIRGKVFDVAKAEFAKAEKAGLSKILAARKAAAKPAAEAETVTAPPAEPCTASIPGIEVMDLEDAVQALWKAGIYAESGMGCTGPLVMMSEANHEKALEILKKAGYVG